MLPTPHRAMALVAGLVLLASPVGPVPAQAQAQAQPGPAAAPSALPYLEHWLLPRYDALAAATAKQEADWTSFCAAPKAESVSGLKTDFRAVGDAWAAVSFITFGPVVLSLRADRFNLYPDKRNAVGRSVPEILADADDSRLQPDRFGRLSAAIQGLPALERVLYEDDGALLSGAQAARRCALGVAIARNLATIAREIRAGWGDEATGVLSEVKQGKGDAVFLPEPGQTLSLLLTDLAGGYQRAVDVNLLSVLGKSLDDARPQAGEGRRAGRERDVVVSLVSSANDLSVRIAAGLPAPAKAQVTAHIAAAQKTVNALPKDLGAAAADPRRRKLLETAVTELKAMQRAVVDPMAAQLGVSLGFNSLDGD